MFPVEESISADLPAGFDLPFFFKPSVCVHVRRQEPLRELFARLTQLLGTQLTTFPSPRTLSASDKPWVCRRAAAGKELPCSERRPDPDTFLRPFPTWTGTARGTGYCGAARELLAEGGQPRGVTGCRWDLC